MLIISISAKNKKQIEDWNQVDYASLDYTLVYNKEYYLKRNPDVAEYYKNGSDKDILNHFIQYGMSEGRVASDNFNISHYKAVNPDLNEKFGDDAKKYYAHYIVYGFNENREAVFTAPDFFAHEIMMISQLNEQKNVVLEFDCDEQFVGKKYLIYELDANINEFSDLQPVYSGKLKKSNIIELPFTDITKKYVVIDRKTNEKLSNYAFIQNPEKMCELSIEPPIAYSKKGLQVSFADIEDFENLNPSFVFTNLFINDIMSLEHDGNVIVYQYADNEYYFKESIIKEYDRIFSRLTSQGINICASVLLKYDTQFDFLYYPDRTSEKAAFYGVNTSTEKGATFLKAFISFMSERYNGSDSNKGMITKWMVGNEVNDSNVYNNVGTMSLVDYVEEYGRTFRIIYNIVKSNIPSAEIYLVMEPWWGIDDANMVFGGKRFLDTFNNYMKSQGNIDWGLAHHAYSFPLCDPKVLNDDEATLSDDGRNMTSQSYFTRDDVDTLTITMENIDVLINYMKQDEFLTEDGNVRSIILSEQGYTSNSNLYGQCEVEQAASLLYAYYKAEMNEYIDGFIYFLQIDDSAASLGNEYYQFGLSSRMPNGEIKHKLSYDVFKIMDTKESIILLKDMLDILRITDWSEVIPEFDVERLGTMNYSNNKFDTVTKIDISKAIIESVPLQQYSGKECLPSITLSLDNRVLKDNVDYDVVYQNNVEPGIATVIVVGLSNYSGMIKTTFEIQ